MSYTRERARLAALVRHHPHEDHGDARRDLRAARLADAICKTVDAAPPLTEEQRSRLALLLRGPSAADGAPSPPSVKTSASSGGTTEAASPETLIRDAGAS